LTSLQDKITKLLRGLKAPQFAWHCHAHKLNFIIRLIILKSKTVQNDKSIFLFIEIFLSIVILSSLRCKITSGRIIILPSKLGKMTRAHKGPSAHYVRKLKFISSQAKIIIIKCRLRGQKRPSFELH